MGGTEAEKYEVLEKIGQGSFGVIRKVRRKTDGHVLCRKEISYHKMSEKEKLQLQAELSILKELRHPNIVAYYEREHLKASHDLHLYMEYCGNGDLGRYISRLKRDNKMAEEEFVWSIFSQLVTALYRCHYAEDPPEVGRNVMGLGCDARPKNRPPHQVILHRDLKPENVFLGADHSVKLGDFGLSKIMTSHDFASTYVGTPYYMSPEICAAEEYSLKSDIWSLGCIIYELCAKSPPFDAKTHLDLIQRIRLGRVPRLSATYSSELQRTIDHCLKVNPNLRPDTAYLLNLPIVKLMRKEQEVVKLGQEMKAEKERATKSQKEAQDRIQSFEAEKQLVRSETDAALRREWEVKARLEINLQVQLETERLMKQFDAEVNRRVAVEMEKLKSAATNQTVLPLTAERPIMVQPVQSDTTTAAADEALVVSSAASTLNESSVFSSSTDLSSLSLSSPPQQEGPQPSVLTKQEQLPIKRTSRTPFSRAQTMFVAGAVPSPMDVTMADPSPAALNHLGLSPRRSTGIGRQSSGKRRVRSNIFASAALKRPSPLSGQDVENKIEKASAVDEDDDNNDEDRDGGIEDDEDEEEEEDIPDLPPSPSLLRANPNNNKDPFKALAAAQQQQQRQRPLRPGMHRMQTAMPLGQHQPLLFKPHQPSFPAPQQPKPSSVFTMHTVAEKQHAVLSDMPNTHKILGRSPDRRISRIPSKKNLVNQTLVAEGASLPASVDISMSPIRRVTVQSAAAHARQQALSSNNGGGGGGLVKGRTLVELQQARAGGRDVATWDPERDEMPSPFLARGRSVKLR